MVLLSGGVTQTVAPTNVSYGVPMYMGTTSSTVPLYGSTSYYSPPVYSAPAPTYSGGATGSTTMVGATPKPAPVVAPAPTPVYTPPPQPTYAPQPQYIPQAPLSGTVSVDVSGLLGGGVDYAQQARMQLASILAAGAKRPEGHPVNYKPYNNILDRFPEATAQRPDLLSDLDGMLRAPRPQQPMPDLVARKPDPVPDLRPAGGLAQQPRIAPEIAYNPPKPVNETRQGGMAPQQGAGAYGRQTGYPQQPQYSPTGAPETDVLYRSQPMMNPEYAQNYAQQQALKQMAMRNVMQGPPQAPPMIQAPGSAPGWNGFAQRMSMLNPRNARANQNMYNWQLRSQAAMDGERSANYRAMMTAATSLADKGLGEAGQNARAMQNIVADVLKQVMKTPTPESVQAAAMKIVDSYPPGPARDQALAASAAYGLDLWQFRNVPMSEKAQSIEQGRDDRHAAAEQKFGYNAEMNPLRVNAQKLKNSRMEKTNPAYVRRMEALASKAELDEQVTRAYGNDLKRAELNQKQAAIHNDVIKHTNEALAKANTINQQYDNAMRNYYAAPAKEREKALKGIEARFGKMDPDTGIPEDVLNARKASRELTGEMQKFAAERPQPAPTMTEPPAVSPMAKQQTRVTRKASLEVPPEPVRVLNSANETDRTIAKSFLTRANGDKARARELAKAEGYSF